MSASSSKFFMGGSRKKKKMVETKLVYAKGSKTIPMPKSCDYQQYLLTIPHWHPPQLLVHQSLHLELLHVADKYPLLHHQLWLSGSHWHWWRIGRGWCWWCCEVNAMGIFFGWRDVVVVAIWWAGRTRRYRDSTDLFFSLLSKLVIKKV